MPSVVSRAWPADLLTVNRYASTVTASTFRSTGSQFSNIPDQPAYRAQPWESYDTFPRFTVSGDFNNDGFDEVAMFIDYTYQSTDGTTYRSSNIEVFKPVGNKLIPLGVWFRTKKMEEFNFDAIKYVVSGNFNNEGGDDIAVLYNYGDPDGNQAIFVFESLGSEFSDYKPYYRTTKSQFNFDSIRSVVSGKYEDPPVSAMIWKGNKKAAVTFCFDDGSHNTFLNAVPYMTTKKCMAPIMLSPTRLMLLYGT